MIEYKGHVLKQYFTGTNDHYYQDIWVCRIGRHDLAATLEYLKNYIDSLYTEPSVLIEQ